MHKRDFTPELTECPYDSGLKVGDVVTFTNDYGVRFAGHRITGFCPITIWGAHVYLDTDCYWHPKKASSLTIESSRTEEP